VKLKKEKEPNRPVGVRSADIFYCKRNRERVHMEHPLFSSKEVRKKCDEEWKALSSVYRKLYEDMSAEDKTRHTKEMGAEPNSETTEKKEKEMRVNLVDPIGLKMISLDYPMKTFNKLSVLAPIGENSPALSSCLIFHLLFFLKCHLYYICNNITIKVIRFWLC
jgi:hypothetical protein